MNILKVKNTNHKSSLYDGNNKNKFLQPKISVIIPVYNALNHIKILFNNLLNNFDFETGEIIIVDDCSDSSTSSYLENFVK